MKLFDELVFYEKYTRDKLVFAMSYSTGQKLSDFESMSLNELVDKVCQHLIEDKFNQENTKCHLKL